MNMTFDQYIANPMGKKNAVFSNREMFRTMYKQKLDVLLVREVGKVKYDLYTSKKGKYYIHFKIPSEKIKGIYYDTVIEFYTDQHSAELSRNLNNYYVRFYSNDPSFVFTFAHAFRANDMLIKDLECKMSKKALKEVAKEKNPKNEVGYVKSIFFAYLLMKQYGLFEKVQFKSYAKQYNPRTFKDQITHADQKIEERINAVEKEAKEKRVEKQKEKVAQQQNRREQNPMFINSSPKVSSVKKVNRIEATKGKKVKKVKKI